MLLDSTYGQQPSRLPRLARSAKRPCRAILGVAWVIAKITAPQRRCFADPITPQGLRRTQDVQASGGREAPARVTATQARRHKFHKIDRPA